MFSSSSIIKQWLLNQELKKIKNCKRQELKKLRMIKHVNEIVLSNVETDQIIKYLKTDK